MQKNLHPLVAGIIFEKMSYLEKHKQSATTGGLPSRRRTADALDFKTIKDQSQKGLMAHGASCDGALLVPGSVIARVCHASGTGCQDVVSASAKIVGKAVSWRTR